MSLERRCFSAALALIASVAAGAQEPARLPGTTVVATRFPEATHDVPMSVEVFAGADLRARGVTTLREALALSAGVAVAPGGDGGPATAVPEFWGLREFDAFLLVVDGVPWGGAFNPAIATLSLRDVERVEVLRGPAPVTYGATSFVGVIHVVHSAAAEKARYASASGGSFGTGSFGIDVPITLDGGWTSRASGDFDRHGYSDDRTSYSRGHALWRVGKSDADRNMWLTGDLNILRQEPASPHPRQGASLSALVPVDANYNPSGAYLDENRIAIFAGFERPVMINARWGTTASFTHSGQSMFRGFLTNISNTTNNASGFKETIDINDLYADTHVTWPAQGGQWRFMTGADVLFAAGEGKGATFTYTAPLSGAATNVNEPSTLDKDAESERRFLGAYASTEWRPNSRFTLNGGVRFNATTEARGEGAEVTHSRPAASIGALVGLWERGANHVRAFVNYRDTFKPAAFDFSLAENEGVLDPETSRSYEGGLKTRFMDGRVDVEASVFQMDFKNLVTATIVGGQPALINAGQTRFKGAEIATDIRLQNALSARATYSAHDGKFVDFVQDFDGTLTQLRGKRFEMSAKALASAGLVLAPEKGFIAHASVNYTGDRYLNKRNTALVPSFSTFDAGLGFRMNRAEIRVDGRNLGDARDAVSESEFGDAQYYLMPARVITLGVALKY